MSRKPSDATLLRQARSELRELERQLNTKKAEAESYRIRATKAEQDVAEWKKRFDALLARTHPNASGGQS